MANLFGRLKHFFELFSRYAGFFLLSSLLVHTAAVGSWRYQKTCNAAFYHGYPFSVGWDPFSSHAEH
jgi:hypothetical protein